MIGEDESTELCAAPIKLIQTDVLDGEGSAVRQVRRDVQKRVEDVLQFLRGLRLSLRRLRRLLLHPLPHQRRLQRSHSGSPC